MYLRRNSTPRSVSRNSAICAMEPSLSAEAAAPAKQILLTLCRFTHRQMKLVEALKSVSPISAAISAARIFNSTTVSGTVRLPPARTARNDEGGIEGRVPRCTKTGKFHVETV